MNHILLNILSVKFTQSAKRHLQDVLEMSFQDRQDILQMSKRCLKRKSERHLEETFARYIVDVLQKTSY